LVLGGGDCVWEDVAAWEKQYGQEWDGLVIAANDIGSWWPRRLDHWVSLHPNKFVAWRQLRAVNGFPPASMIWGRPQRQGEVLLWDQEIVPWPGGSSGLLAVQVAQQLGCRRAVLCGVPMTTTGHFKESQENFGPSLWFGSAGHWTAWVRHQEHLQGWVRSMSGKTRELLGEPTAAWLTGQEVRVGG
jgi:hypothetical protein